MSAQEKQINVKMTEALHTALKVKCAGEGVSISKVITASIQAYLAGSIDTDGLPVKKSKRSKR